MKVTPKIMPKSTNSEEEKWLLPGGDPAIGDKGWDSPLEGCFFKILGHNFFILVD